MEGHESTLQTNEPLEDLQDLEEGASTQQTQVAKPIELSDKDKTQLEERGWTDKPLPRFGLAAGFGLLIFVSSQWVLPKQKGSAAKGPPANDAEVLAQNVSANSDPDPQDLCRDVGVGDYDVQEQNELLKTCGALASTEVAPPPSPPSPPKGTATKPENAVKPVIRPSAVPSPKPAVRARPPLIAKRIPAPRPQPVSSPKPVATAVSKPQVSSEQAAPEVDPYERWQQMADLGHTQSEGSEIAQASSDSEEDYPTENADYNPEEVIVAEDISDVPDSGGSEIAAADSGPSSGGNVPIGTTVKAKLMMPITWGQEGSVENDIFLAKLSEPMGSLPKGTVLTLKASSATSDGLVKLQAESASVNGHSQSLNGAVATDPIRAKRKGAGKGINMGDVLGVVIGGLGNAAEVINRPQESTTLAADGLSQVVSSNENRNLIAAIGEGAANQMLSQAQERVEDIESSGEPYFKIGEGKSITIRVLEDLYL